MTTQAHSISLKKSLSLDGYLLLTLGLSIFAIAPLLYPGYFQTHSGFVPLWSINRLRENLADLSWLPVLMPFDPWRSGGLLPYYLAAFLPTTALNALKLVSALGILAGSSGLYLWLKSWFGQQGATVAALVYTYAPFTIVTLYVRGAWSEAFFWGILPWALLAATYLVVARSNIWFIIIAAGFWAGLGLSQFGLSLWAYLLLVVMLLIFHRSQVLQPAIAAGTGLIVAGLFIFPRLIHAIQPSPINFSQHLVYPAQLLAASWGYGLSRPGWEDGLSLSLGLASLGLTILSFSIWRGGPDRRPWLFAGLALFSVLAFLPLGGWIWRIPGLNYLLTYPWQLLGFATLGLAVMAGVGFWLDERLRPLPIFGAAILFVLLPMYPNLEAQYITFIPDDPQAIYGQNEILLLSHAFLVDNPDASADAKAEDRYLPVTGETYFGPLSTLHLQVRWQAVAQPAQDYKIFAHLIDEQGQLITQVDVFPQNGARPTSTWLPGEIIEDTYTFKMASLKAPKPAQVWLGFYDEGTMARLPALGDDEGRAFLDVR
jgi:hypothetical protein